MNVPLILAATALTLTVSTLPGCATHQKAGQMSDDEQRTAELVDSLRDKGSFESARDDLTALAGSVAEKINRAVPGGKQWRFDTTSEFAKTLQHGAVCDGLPGDVALKPDAAPVVFDPPFGSAEFRIAVDVIREEAAKVGATEESSLFNDSARREYFVSGNGYTFRIMQMKVALLTVSGDCRLLRP